MEGLTRRQQIQKCYEEEIRLKQEIEHVRNEISDIEREHGPHVVVLLSALKRTLHYQQQCLAGVQIQRKALGA